MRRRELITIVGGAAAWSLGGAMRFLLPLILILCSAGINACADAPAVHTQNGDVRGVLQGAVESFKALPYAAPPVGDLRWKPPQDPANWVGVRDGSEFSSACPQKDPSGSIIGSEDCLYLNVFRPQAAQGLPVIVFIHGGHNVIGSAGLQQNGVAAYDGSELAQHNVVVVTINYRLGALGFIAHRELSKESGYHGSGNYGYMDQIQALKWVSRNIAAFGGDPGKVTLFGQSAGGGGVSVLMASPLAKGLFHRAIIHSGQFATQDLTNAEKTGLAFSQKLNCLAPDELKCMRNKSAGEIVVAMPIAHPPGSGGSANGPSRFLPVVDAWILHDSPLEIIRRGEHHRVPLLIGNVLEETAWIYINDSKNIHTDQDYIKAVEADYGAANAPRLLSLYPSSGYPSPRQAYNAISGDHWFVCPAQRITQAVSVSQREFVGRFLYTHALPVSGPNGVPLGDSHGFDLVFVFGTFGIYQLTPTPDELTLKEKFQKIWTDFARSGSPGDFWDRYDAARDNYVKFDTPMLDGIHLRTNQCDYWPSVGKPAAEVPEVAVDAAKPPVVNEGPLLPQELSVGGKR